MCLVVLCGCVSISSCMVHRAVAAIGLVVRTGDDKQRQTKQVPQQVSALPLKDPVEQGCH